MADERRGWQPDPFGVHEFRFFSDDGSATLLVRDGGVNSYDKPPADGERVQAPVPTDGAFVQTQVQERVPTDGAFVQTRLPTETGLVQGPDGSTPTAAPVPEPKAPLAAPDVVRPLREANPDSRDAGASTVAAGGSVSTSYAADLEVGQGRLRRGADRDGSKRRGADCNSSRW